MMQETAQPYEAADAPEEEEVVDKWSTAEPKISI